MSQFIEACIQSPINLVLTVLLAMTALYWLVVIVGAVGLDSLDFDVDADVDVDLDVDTDVSIIEAGMGTLVMKFFHIGTVPVLVLWSVFILAMWAVGVLAYPWVGGWGWVLQALMLIPFAFAAMFITKIVTLPLKLLFEKIKQQEEAEQHVNLIGQRCTVVSLTVDHRHGQVEVATEGAPLRLNAKTGDPQIVLNKGDEAVLIAQDDGPGVYIVRGF